MEGNQMKMREALLKLRSEIGRFCYNDWIPYDVWQECDDVISHALSEPPRNCDIGTEQERHRRFLTFCNAHVDCVDCPIKAYWTKALSCGILWDQMPYEAEEGGAE